MGLDPRGRALKCIASQEPTYLCWARTLVYSDDVRRPSQSRGSPRGLTRVSELLEVPVLLTAMAWKGHSNDADKHTEGAFRISAYGSSLPAQTYSRACLRSQTGERRTSSRVRWWCQLGEVEGGLGHTPAESRQFRAHIRQSLFCNKKSYPSRSGMAPGRVTDKQ